MNDGHFDDDHRSPRRSFQLLALVGMLGMEFVAVLAALGYLLVELVVETPTSYASAIAITILTAIAAAWLAAIILDTWRGRGWVRAAIVVWQVLQLSLGIGSLQGVFAQPAFGWPLIIVAVVAFALLFTKPVIAQTTNTEG